MIANATLTNSHNIVQEVFDVLCIRECVSSYSVTVAFASWFEVAGSPLFGSSPPSEGVD